MATRRSPPSGRATCKIPQVTIDEIRARVDLLALVGERVKLKREGQDYLGLCPFHGEHTPSFRVRPPKGYYCHGCGANGDAVAWVQHFDGVDFAEAVRRLGARVGVDADHGARPAGPATTRRSGPRTLKVGEAVVGSAGREEEPGDAPPEEEGAPSGWVSPFAWSEDLWRRCRDELSTPDAAPVLDYLRTGRGFSDETIHEFDLGALIVRAADGRVLDRYATIPVRDAERRVVNVRFRSVPGTCLRCGGSGCKRCKEGQVKKVFLRCKDRPSALFGADRLRKDPSLPVLLTEGEFDVVALWQYGVRGQVVSGTAGAGTWLDGWLETLEPYQHFVLCYDADASGDKGAKTVADRLGRYRCSRARLPDGHKDANDCLKAGVTKEKLFEAVFNPEQMTALRFVSAAHYVDEIEADFADTTRLVGTPTGSKRIDACVGGLRPGLWTFTGDSGSGKTTFTHWLLLEQARRGVPVAFTSFEQTPKGSIHKLLRMELRGDPRKFSPDERRAAVLRLDALPIRFVAHYGQTGRDALVEAIRYAVRRFDVRAFLVDHLGYIQDPDAPNEARDITEIVKALAVLAENEGVAIVLVAHPNNTSIQQQRRVMMGDLKGASAIRQESSVVAVVVRHDPRGTSPPTTAVHFDKIRSEFGFNGSSCSLAFDPVSCVYADTWAETPMGQAGGSGTSIVDPAAATPPKGKPQREPDGPALQTTRRSRRSAAGGEGTSDGDGG